jgi:hypothetical protein
MVNMVKDNLLKSGRARKIEDDEVAAYFDESDEFSWDPDLDDLEDGGVIELSSKIRLGDEIDLDNVLEAQLDFRLGEGSLPGDEFRLDRVEDVDEDDEDDEDDELDEDAELDEAFELNEHFLDRDFEYGQDIRLDLNGLVDDKPYLEPLRRHGPSYQVHLENVRLDREMGFRNPKLFAPSDLLEMRREVRDFVAGKLVES